MLIGTLALLSLAASGALARRAAPVLAFVDVSVIPMDRERVLEHQTVIVRDGRVAQVGAAASVALPAGATRIDGRGKFLMPGLVDMHAHFVAGTESLDDPAGRQLALYVANGFTTVRGLGGVPTALGLRDRIARGELVGPQLVVASPSINGGTARTVQDVVRLVDSAKAQGFDLVKTHGGWPRREFYDSLDAAVHRAGLPLVGHVTPEYGLRRAMDANQEVEHLDGFIAEIAAAGTPPTGPGQVVLDTAILAHIDAAKLKALAEEMKRRNIWNGPTLALFNRIVSAESPDELSKRAEMQYSLPSSVQQYAQQKAGTLGMPEAGRRQFAAVRDQVVRALHDAGARLLVGSDTPQFFLTPGFGALDELDAFVHAGLSPYDALEAATRNPAEYLHRADVGTVAVGKQADLILLDANPLANVSNVRKLRGVMLRGRWIDQAGLAAMLADVRAHVAGK
ncbi:MAG: amidohydrolase [Gemmatimonadetes bacterium]|nr:amidohydrolase [Gemmatimonadota bacterium]